MKKRFRAFAAWLGSFTACCCCIPGAWQNPNPGQAIVQPDIPDGDDAKKKKPVKEERISRANFEKIQDGMSIKEVQAILGPGTEPATKAKAAIRQFVWRRPGEGQDVRITVTFAQGQVTNKTMIGD